VVGSLYYNISVFVKPDKYKKIENYFFEFNPYKGADTEYSLAHTLKPQPSTGAILITNYKQERSNIDLSYTIAEDTAVMRNAFIDFPLYNFKGYKALFNKTVLLNIKTGTNYFIRVTLPIAERSGTITLRYKYPPQFFFGYAVSILTLAALIWRNLFFRKFTLLQNILQKRYRQR
jgi:hypothetical protein